MKLLKLYFIVRSHMFVTCHVFYTMLFMACFGAAKGVEAQISF